MGYSGLDRITDSDLAADLAFKVFAAAAKELSEGLKERADSFNTEGCINVALIFKQCFCDSNDPCVYTDEKLRIVAKQTVKRLEKLMERSKKMEWEDEPNKDWHLKSYLRMIKNLNGFLEKGN